MKPASAQPPGRLRRAVFLDRDGVINRAVVREGKPYPPASVEEFELLPGVAEACEKLKRAGFVLVVATNQPDVGRGTQSKETVEAIHAHLRTLLPLDRVEVSYDSGQEQPPSEFRKPRPGLLLRAAREMGLDLAQSFAVAGQGGGWLRESYTLRTDPPDADQANGYLSIQGLQRKGR